MITLIVAAPFQATPLMRGVLVNLNTDGIRGAGEPPLPEPSLLHPVDQPSEPPQSGGHLKA